MYNINNIGIKIVDDTVKRYPQLSDEEYFAGDTFKGYVSNSSMSLINPSQGGSPSKFLVGFEAKKSKGALELGSAVHRMILEKGQYYIDELDKPSEKVCNVMDIYFGLLQKGILLEEEAIIVACKEADYYAKSLTQTRIDNVLRDGKLYLEQLYDKAECEGCLVLTREHKDKLDKCLESVKLNERMIHFLEGKLSNNFKRYNEDVFTVEAEATLSPKDESSFEDIKNKIFIKIKVDNWSVDFENKVITLNDLKTTGVSVGDFGGCEYESMSTRGEIYKYNVSGSFEKFHYYRQMAFYLRVLKSYAAKEYDATEENGWTFKVNMLVVETNAPHHSQVFNVSQKWLDLGTYEYESLLKRIAYHDEYGYDTFTHFKPNGEIEL